MNRILSQVRSWIKSPHTHARTRLRAFFSGTTRWPSTRKVKPIRISLKQDIVSGSGISWAICKSAPRFWEITTPTPHHSVFTGRAPFLPPNQRQSTVLFCSLAVLDPRVGHTMDVLSPLISVLCHSDWHGESCPRLDVVKALKNCISAA